MSDERYELKYRVERRGDPKKVIDCIVLEFKDKTACYGILAWAYQMKVNGHLRLYHEICAKVAQMHGAKFISDFNLRLAYV